MARRSGIHWTLCFGALLQLSGHNNRERVAEFAVPQGAVDIDTMAIYEKIK